MLNVVLIAVCSVHWALRRIAGDEKPDCIARGRVSRACRRQSPNVSRREGFASAVAATEPRRGGVLALGGAARRECQKLLFRGAARHPVDMTSARPATTITLAGRMVTVRTTAFKPVDVARVVGETEAQVILRLRSGDLAGVLGSPAWLVRVESAAALAEAKVRAGLIDPKALMVLAAVAPGTATQLSTEPPCVFSCFGGAATFMPVSVATRPSRRLMLP